MRKSKEVAVREIDSEAARMRASWALSYHQGTKIGAQMTVMNAIACGIQLQKAKESLPHGDFRKWQTKYLKTISTRTATRYLSLVQRMSHELATKWDTVALLLDVSPEKFTPEYASKIAPRVKKLVEGKSVRELYEDFGIIKPRQTATEKVLKRIGPRTGDKEEDRKNLTAAWVDKVEETLAGAKYSKDFVRDKDLNRFIDSLISAAAEWGIPLVVKS